MKIGLLDSERGRYFPLRKNLIRIGCKEDCHVVLEQPGVFDFHAEIAISHVGIELTTATSHPIDVNKFPVAKGFLCHNDRIQLGEVELTFLLSDEPSAKTKSCARCGVEISRDTTHRYLDKSNQSVQLCAVCEERQSDRRGPQEQTMTLQRVNTSELFPVNSKKRDPFGFFEEHDEQEQLREITEMTGLVPISVIAHGAQGIIYKMRMDQDLVAVKRLKFEFNNHAKERFQREAKVLKALDHPSLVKLYRSHELSDTAVLVMEYIDGPSLEELIQAEEKPPLDKILSYAVDVAEGLVYLNNNGVIHRDIKPSNVLVDPHDSARLVDFGLVRYSAPTNILTAPGQMIGSPCYMSPEQVRAKNLSSKSDVFSLGVTFFEAIVGKRPFPGNTPVELFTAIVEDPAPIDLLLELPAGGALARCFGQLLTKDVNERPTPERALDLLRYCLNELKKSLAN